MPKINASLFADLMELRSRYRDRLITPIETADRLLQLLVDDPHGEDLTPFLTDLNARLVDTMDSWFRSLEVNQPVVGGPSSSPS